MFIFHNNYYIFSIQLLNPNTLSVEVTGSRVHGLAGTSYTLTCTVTLSTRIMGTPVYIQCEGPSRTFKKHTDTSDDTVIVHKIMIDKLTLYDEGNYTCIASNENPLISIITYSSRSMTLNIRSK